jgi:hypothetical protein
MPLLVPLSASATAYTWSGATSNAWNLSTNWSGGTFPNATTDQATINISTHNPISLTTTASVGGTGIGPSGDLTYALFIDSTAGPTALDIGATTGILQMLGGIYNSEIITLEGTLRNQTTTTSGSHPFSLNGPGSLTLAGGTITSNNTHGGWTFNQAINGYGTISNNSANTLTSTLTATNNATPITLTAGTLNLAGGTLARTGTATITDSGTIAGYGTITTPFTGTATMSANAATYGQAININNVTQTGALTLGFSAKGSYGLSNVTLGAAGNTGTILSLTGSTTYSQFTNLLPGTFNNNWGNVNYGLINVTGNTTINGAFSLPNYYVLNITNSTLTVNNPGTITGFNTNSPPVFVLGTGGNLVLTGNTSLGTSAPIPINGGSVTHTGGTFSAYAFTGYGSVSGITSLPGGAYVTPNGGTSGTPQTLFFATDAGGASLGSHSGAGVGFSSATYNTLDLNGTFNFINPANVSPNGGTIALDAAVLNTYDPTGGSGGTPTTWNVTLYAGAINVTNNSTLIGNITSSAGITIQSGKTLSINDTAGNSGTTVASSGSILGGNVAVASNATLTSSGVLQIDALSGGGTLAVTGGTAAFTQKVTPWTTNPAAVQNIGMLTIGSPGTLDVTNNLVNVNYGAVASPYIPLAAQVNSGVITQSSAVPYRTVGIYDTALNLDGLTPGGTTVRLGYASPGDTMLRGKVDSSDILNILSAGKYGIGPSNARWDEGDFDHNFLVDSSDIIAVLASGEYNTGTSYNSPIGPMLVVGGPPSSLLATIIYNSANGDVKIDPNGNTMTGFRLRDSAGSFFVASAVFPPGGAFTTDTAAEKFWSTFSSGSYLTSVFDLGDIAPSGLTDAQFLADMNNLSGDSVWTKAGGGSFNYNFTSVPEPATLALLLLGGVGLARGRLRRTLRTVR